MKNILFRILITAVLVSPVAAQNSAIVIPNAEMQAKLKEMIEKKVQDDSVRVANAGDANVGVFFISPPLRQHSADRLAAGAAAALVAESDELLNPFPGIDFGRVQVSVRIDADLMEPMELAGFAPASAEPA